VPKNIVFEINSEKNGKIKVVDFDSGRVLQTEQDAFLSCSENYKYIDQYYWGVFLEEIKKYRPNIKRALVFGLAGGVIQNKLFKMYPGIEIVSIEYDHTMNDIYNYFFGGNLYNNHKIYNLDAKDFVKNSHKFENYEEHFDLIFVDTFSSFEDKEYDNFNNFYKDLKKFLRKDGVLSINMIVKTESMFDRSKFYLQNLRQNFSFTNFAMVGTIFGNSNLVTFSSDKLNL